MRNFQEDQEEVMLVVFAWPSILGEFRLWAKQARVRVTPEELRQYVTNLVGGEFILRLHPDRTIEQVVKKYKLDLTEKQQTCINDYIGHVLGIVYDCGYDSIGWVEEMMAIKPEDEAYSLSEWLHIKQPDIERAIWRLAKRSSREKKPLSVHDLEI